MCPYEFRCNAGLATHSLVWAREAVPLERSYIDGMDDEAIQHLDRLLCNAIANQWFHMPLAGHVDKLDKGE